MATSSQKSLIYITFTSYIFLDQEDIMSLIEIDSEEALSYYTDYISDLYKYLSENSTTIFMNTKFYSIDVDSIRLNYANFYGVDDMLNGNMSMEASINASISGSLRSETYKMNVEFRKFKLWSILITDTYTDSEYIYMKMGIREWSFSRL